MCSHHLYQPISSNDGNMFALHSNNTCDIVILPPEKTIIEPQWVYTHMFSLDYGTTFSPMTNSSCVCIFRPRVSIHQGLLHQLDI